MAVTGVPANAALPNEEGTFHAETQGDQGVYSPYRPSSAYQAGNLSIHLTAWTDWQHGIWLSLNNGAAFRITTSENTSAPPTVISRGNGFMVFHTGQGGQIYYAVVNSNGSNDGTWRAVPNARTRDYTPVGATTGFGGRGVLAWRGATTDNIYITSVDGTTNSWNTPVQAPGATTYTAPAITYNTATDSYLVAHVGTDTHMYTAISDYPYYNNQRWTPWTSHGGNAYGQPAVAPLNNGHWVAAVMGGDQRVWQQELDPNGVSYSGTNWGQESTATPVGTVPWLVYNAARVWLLISTYNQGQIMWKQTVRE
ncbi:hypothetical protein ABZ883_04955 [Streptomyces sp. NPDC046977]|uniref:hypothetical protein n=1 Tax=Streptomyces sp. NPDC046977 TaxID=3154703 RepID=UPI0033CD3542